MNSFIRIHPADTVAVALRALAKGQRIEDGIVVVNSIPVGHKVALTAIPQGAPVIKYGETIGLAAKNIRPGSWVHSHNLKSGLTKHKAYHYHPVPRPAALRINSSEHFLGFVRSNGRVGTRNEIWILPLVHCVNKFTEQVAALATRRFKTIANFHGFDSFSHPYGCSQVGEDLENTQAILRNLALHPNAGGVLIVSLGCENNTLDSFMDRLGKFDHARIKTIKLQDVSNDYDTALELLASLHRTAVKSKRTQVSINKLVLGVKCGGSDGFSGITANPLIGSISNLVASQNGTVLMGEVPEMFGAEHVLMKKAYNKKTFSKIVTLINKYKTHFAEHGCPIYENPSPGNKEGGITTLEEKSLGCIQKAGNSIINNILEYGESWHAPKINLVESPGNDAVSSTALTAAGATLILFSTGRGTPFGAPVPTIKISTNTALFKKKSNWIDFDAGRFLHEHDKKKILSDLWDLVLKTASGFYRTKNEQYGFKEISILKNGVTL